MTAPPDDHLVLVLAAGLLVAGVLLLVAALAADIGRLTGFVLALAALAGARLLTRRAARAG